MPSIPFIPMTYPQNRKPAYGEAFVKAGYERVISDLEKATGAVFSDEALKDSIAVYNEHNQVMREVSDLMAEHPEITAAQRSDIFKSAGFMTPERHTTGQRIHDFFKERNTFCRKEDSYCDQRHSCRQPVFIIHSG